MFRALPLPMVLIPLLSQAAPEWIPDPFDLPPNAVSAGAPGEYVCRSEYAGGMHAGSFSDGFCHIDYGGIDLPQTSFEILSEEDVSAIHWAAADSGEVPAGAFPTGAEPWPADAGGIAQYSCRSDIWLPDSASGGYAHSGVHLGKLVGSFCNVPMRDLVVSAPHYEVLVIDGASPIRSRPAWRSPRPDAPRFAPDGRRCAPRARIVTLVR